MGKAGIEVNLIVLMLLNLLPILPLDGGRIVASLLPTRMAWGYAKLEPWGFPILLVLLFMGALERHPRRRWSRSRSACSERCSGSRAMFET